VYAALPNTSSKARHATYNRSRDCTEPAVTSTVVPCGVVVSMLISTTTLKSLVVVQGCVPSRLSSGPSRKESYILLCTIYRTSTRRFDIEMSHSGKIYAPVRPSNYSTSTKRWFFATCNYGTPPKIASSKTTVGNSKGYIIIEMDLFVYSLL
jgi:hypothetical protein